MEHSQSKEYQKDRSRIQEILSKSGGEIKTSLTAFQNLEHRIDEDLKVEKSPRGKVGPFFHMRESEGEE